MSEDFLPLETGNLWRYEVTDSGGAPVARFEIEVVSHVIENGASVYIFSLFPLAPGVDSDQSIGVRFDRASRTYIFTDGSEEMALFPAEGARLELVEADSGGLPRTVRLTWPDRSLTLERGLGLKSATLETLDGSLSVALTGARVGNEIIGEAQPVQPALDVEDPVDRVALSSETAPVLEVEAVAEGQGHRLLLRVRNPTDKLLAFNFTTSQNFDFLVTDPATGEVVWQWARRMFFSQVIRSEAIRIGGQWEFEAEWNHRDNEFEPVRPGTYLLQGVLVSSLRFASQPIQIEVR